MALTIKVDIHNKSLCIIEIIPLRSLDIFDNTQGKHIVKHLAKFITLQQFLNSQHF